MSDQQDISEDEALAAEYVLRLLDADAERAFELRLQAEPDLRARVHFWEGGFAALTNDIREEVPSPSVKAKLVAEVSGEKTSSRRGWGWSWLAFPALTAVALAAFLAFGPMLRGPAFDPTLHATLISEDGAIHIEAGYAPDGNLFKVIPEQGAPAAGRVFELWVISAETQAPVSLGVIPADRESLFEITPEIAVLMDGGTLAVSDEPEGGSPTGAPTGAILATDEFFDADLFQAG
ncbi:anti-sigma factor domain-containing protein [Yoonia sp. SS1-5]|uniref:Anti-sigma factor domain-containing protein n=1 Tax=Yoonia rhodophyticola TaxID=3137370 RepID=A0AAN0NLI6_9RHOB